LVKAQGHGRPHPKGFWWDLSEEDRRALGASARNRRYAKGDPLVREGEPAGYVVVILDGYAKVFTTSEDGRESILGVRGPGDTVGEMGTQGSHAPRNATVTALRPLSGLVVDGERFHAYVKSSPKALDAYQEQWLARMNEAGQRLAMGSADGERKLAALLCELSGRFGAHGPDGEIEIDMPLSQNELGSWAGTSRETVARAYGGWREAFVIRNGRRTVTILDPGALELIRDGKYHDTGED